jgi:hypothetical protein
VKHFSTVYNQFLKLVPRAHFQTCVDHYQGDYRVRTMNCWSQFGTMSYAQLTGKTSLRDVVIGFANKENYFYHLGLKTVARSTLADANRDRDCRIYQELFEIILGRCRDLTPKHKFRFKNNLKSFDATTISLSLELCPWAKFRQAKGAIKVHTRLDHSGQLPDFIHITTGNVHEINVARTLNMEEDDIAVFDRAMVKYKWLYQIDQKKAYFVTRAKDNMSYEVVRNAEHRLPRLSARARKKGILKDQVIRITGTKAGDIPIELRLVVYQDPETAEIYEYLTNLFHLSALTIAQIYKARWEIELFFKWIKQHLKVKTFLGTSENAVMTQIWIAMITYLLLAYLKYQTRCHYTLLEMHRLIRENVFARVQVDSLLIPNWKDKLGQQLSLALNPAQLTMPI